MTELSRWVRLKTSKIGTVSLKVRYGKNIGNRYSRIASDRYTIRQPMSTGEVITEMAQEVVFGLHTGEFKKWISEKEANSIKGFLGLKPDEGLTSNTFFYEQGITKLWIEKVPGKSRPRHYIHMIVNFARASGVGNHIIMPYKICCVRKVFSSVNRVLKELRLSDGNRKIQNWTVARVDSVFDIFEERTSLLMQLLNQYLDLSDQKKKCERIEIKGKTLEQLIYESLRFGNASYTYNIYVKLTEVFDKAKKAGRAVTPEELKEVRGILRVERQNHESACKRLLPNMKVGDLADSKVHDGILKTMIDEIAVFFGRDDYGIEEMKGLYNRIVAVCPRPPDKRQYGSFPRPCRTGDGRFKATITLYYANSGRRQISVAGGTMGAYEKNVLRKLREAYMHNRAYLKSDDSVKRGLAIKSADSIIRFNKTVKTATVKQETEKFIRDFQIKEDL